MVWLVASLIVLFALLLWAVWAMLFPLHRRVRALENELVALGHVLESQLHSKGKRPMVPQGHRP